MPYLNDSPEDEIPLPCPPILTEEETSRQLRQDQLRWVSDMLATALDNRGIPHGPSIFEMINTMVKAIDDSKAEVVAVHGCWDNFVDVVVQAIPDLKRRPLFGQAEMIRDAIITMRGQLEYPSLGR